MWDGLGWGRGIGKNEVIEESRRLSGLPQATVTASCHVGFLMQPSAIHQLCFEGAEVTLFI